jgi:hypothetical protein
MNDQNQTSLWLLPFGEAAPRLVADELGPLPGPASGWFGYYGHVEWDSLFDWWPEVTPTVLPVTGNALPESLLLIIAGVLALVAGWGLRLRLRKLRLSSISVACIKRSPPVTMKVTRRQRVLTMGGILCSRGPSWNL